MYGAYNIKTFHSSLTHACHSPQAINLDVFQPVLRNSDKTQYLYIYAILTRFKFIV